MSDWHAKPALEIEFNPEHAQTVMTRYGHQPGESLACYANDSDNTALLELCLAELGLVLNSVGTK